MPSILDNMKAILEGMSVTWQNFKEAPITLNYPLVRDEGIPADSRGMLRMVEFHSDESITNKSEWYPGTRWAPCTTGCPAHTDARRYVTLAGEAKWREGLDLLRRTYPFVASLGRVCPAPCEKSCSRGFTGPEPIAIRKLKRTFSDWEETLPIEDQFSYEEYCCSTPLNGKKVAIIGGGPAGYQSAMLLRAWGFECTIFEARDIPGGFLTLGIPKYRLPRRVVNREMERIHSLDGIHMVMSTEIGLDVPFQKLRDDFDEVIIACGAWKPYHLGLANEEKPWVYYGEDFLEEQLRGRLLHTPKRVVVVGGGNTGFDCGRTARRLGSEVLMIYRRTRNEMPSEEEEIEDGEEEGIHIEWLTSPHKIVLDESGNLKGLEVIKNRLGAKDRSGRRRPVPIEGSETLMECDMVITALGRMVDIPWLPEEIKIERWGTIRVDENGETTMPGVWAAGDVVNVSTIIEAIGMADKACIGIAKKHGVLPPELPFLYNYEKKDNEYLAVTPFEDGSSPGLEHPPVQRRKGLGEVPDPPVVDFTDPTPWKHQDKQKPFRAMNLQVPMPKLPGEVRVQTFDELDLGFTLEMAQQEGMRCFGCSAEMCVGCGVCVDACPDSCIHLESPKNDEGWEYPAIYSIDLARCCYCGLCTENCPTDSLVWTSNFEMSLQEKQNSFLTKERMDLGLVRLEKDKEEKS
ncbi:MAG: FAD-dependent oxidoreductase [Vulcanimicrobiota bacterium]